MKKSIASGIDLDDNLDLGRIILKCLRYGGEFSISTEISDWTKAPVFRVKFRPHSPLRAWVCPAETVSEKLTADVFVFLVEKTWSRARDYFGGRSIPLDVDRDLIGGEVYGVDGIPTGNRDKTRAERGALRWADMMGDPPRLLSLNAPERLPELCMRAVAEDWTNIQFRPQARPDSRRVLARVEAK